MWCIYSAKSKQNGRNGTVNFKLINQKDIAHKKNSYSDKKMEKHSEKHNTAYRVTEHSTYTPEHVKLIFYLFKLEESYERKKRNALICKQYE